MFRLIRASSPDVWPTAARTFGPIAGTAYAASVVRGTTLRPLKGGSNEHSQAGNGVDCRVLITLLLRR